MAYHQLCMTPRELGERFRTRPSSQPNDMSGVVKRALEEVCAVFGATDALLVWEETEEPWVIVGTKRDEQFTCREEKSDDAESFAWEVPLSFPIIAASGEGRIYVATDRLDEATSLAADALGRLVGEQLDRHLHVAASTREAVARERVRVARDLHDGLLQSFTGIVLQLETAHSILETQPDEAKRMLTEAEAALMADQRELRSYVQQLRPRAAQAEAPFDFGARVDDLRARMDQQWGIALSADVSHVDPSISKFLGYETFRLVHEAVMNSAKHGAAKNVDVRVRTSDGKMRIEVSDDGVGFSFRGRLTLDRIRETGSGPFMLAERVAALNGDLVVDSSEAGAHVEIAVPLGFAGEGA
jgi:signal transduction histidine kinase